MKKMFNKPLSLLLTLSLLSCKESTIKGNLSIADFAQKLELVIDNKKTVDPTPVISSAYTSSNLLLHYFSEKEDIQFGIIAYIQDLKIGSYQVYDCKSASECDENVPDHNQSVLLAPYPKATVPPLNLFRIAYYAPKIGLKPLTLDITSVTDEQQEGNPFKTKRIKGQFSGSLAHVEQTPGGYDWHVIGKTTQMEGNFDMFCTLR